MSVRPERMRLIDREGTLAAGEVALDGTISEIVYTGPATRLPGRDRCRDRPDLPNAPTPDTVPMTISLEDTTSVPPGHPATRHGFPETPQHPHPQH